MFPSSQASVKKIWLSYVNMHRSLQIIGWSKRFVIFFSIQLNVKTVHKMLLNMQVKRILFFQSYNKEHGISWGSYRTGCEYYVLSLLRQLSQQAFYYGVFFVCVSVSKRTNEKKMAGGGGGERKTAFLLPHPLSFSRSLTSVQLSHAWYPYLSKHKRK